MWGLEERADRTERLRSMLLIGLLLLADIFGRLSTIDNASANISSAALMGDCTVVVLMISMARVIERGA